MISDQAVKDISENVRRRMVGLWPKVYMVIGFVLERSTKRRGNQTGTLERVVHREKVFLALDRAREYYDEVRNEVSTYSMYDKYPNGGAKLFVPHVFDSGELATWPDRGDPGLIKNEGYIEIYSFGD